MPKFHVSRSTTINSTPDNVFKMLNDFNHWLAWSPWLIMEPEVSVTISDDAKYYEWKGKRTGEGNMKIIDEVEDKSLSLDLTFLKPWKSTAKVHFSLSADGPGTKVTWDMNSALPFFMFWMKKMMINLIGSDYDRGLNLLKDFVEKGVVESKLEFKGTSEFPGATYIGVKTTCSISEIGDAMISDFGKLEEFMKDHADIAKKEAYTIYHKWDIAKQTAFYTACVGVISIPDSLPNGVFSGEIKPSKVYTLRHIGAYHHLGNAWTTLYTMHRGKEFKTIKGAHPFEHYISDPKETEPKDSITDIIFPIK
ncbi:MAG: SRPBCC family protein [Balneolaceae bacterium]